MMDSQYTELHLDAVPMLSLPLACARGCVANIIDLYLGEERWPKHWCDHAGARYTFRKHGRRSVMNADECTANFLLTTYELLPQNTFRTMYRRTVSDSKISIGAGRPLPSEIWWASAASGQKSCGNFCCASSQCCGPWVPGATTSQPSIAAWISAVTLYWLGNSTCSRMHWLLS